MKKNNPQHQLLLETHSKWSLHYLTGHNLEWYFRFIGRAIFYLAVINLLLSIMSGFPSLNDIYAVVLVPLIFIIELLVYGWLGWKAIKLASQKTLLNTMKFMTSAVSGAIAGFLLGLFMVLFKIFWFREAWTFFNIVTEPVISMFEGFVVAGLVVGLALLIFKIISTKI